MNLYRMAQWGLFLFQGELQIIRSVVSKRDFQFYRSCISIFVFCIILMHITCNLQALLRRIACANLLPGGIFSVYLTEMKNGRSLIPSLLSVHCAQGLLLEFCSAS